MRNIVIVDTNFLVGNIGSIKELIKELTEKEIDVYVPEIVKDEFINIQLRKLEDTYNSIFENNFNNKIILYNKQNMLERAL